MLVEDDPELAAALGAALGRHGHSSDHARTAEDALLMLNAVHYAAVLLDLGLPGEDGFAVLRALRQGANPVPVIVTTARSGVGDRISGLDAGADDYLVKPFAVDELLARLRAVLRRRVPFQGATLALGDLRYDAASRELRVGDALVPLSARETELAELLVRRAGHVVGKRLVEDQLFGLTDSLGSNAVEVYIHRLRRKIEQAGAGVKIETIRGVGYMMRVAAP
nr:MULTISPECIES: response regulator transcription factor [unclassified Sphingomonas]